VELAMHHQCIGGTLPVPPLFMEMQTGSTNNHNSQIFFVLAAPVYWWDWLAAPVLMVHYKGKCLVNSTNQQADEYSFG
jgi:hypothetical protein